MNVNLPLPQDQKLTVVFRVEPGCLGPDGRERIEEFCGFARTQVESVDADFVHWEIIPRFDKTLPEMQYAVSSKRLNHLQAEKYLKVFNKSLDEFETHLFERVTHLIEQYLGR